MVLYYLAVDNFLFTKKKLKLFSAAGTVITGLAAGLRPQFRMWPSILSSSGINSARRIDNVYGVTLAADLAQTAMMKKRGQSYTGPDGYFNNSLCPSDFLLTSNIHSNYFSDPTFTHMTVAEINGGIDGLVLGLHANDWERRTELSLSQVRNLLRVAFQSCLFSYWQSFCFLNQLSIRAGTR